MKLPPLFNPSNDMALATNVRQYFPPRHIQQMEEDLASLSRFWESGPWGWSLATKQRYMAMGIPKRELPTDEWLSTLRQLSSREFGVQYYQAPFLSPQKGEGSPFIPCQAKCITNLQNLQLSIVHYPLSIIKSLWSSSGRGNIIVQGEPDEATLRRIGKTIREQGGVLVEPFYENKVLDFAMEFHVGDEGTDFVGYSVFSADETGHYGGNYVESQTQLLERIDLPAELQIGRASCRERV